MADHAPLGIGITYTSALEPLLDQFPDLIDVLEIEPQTLWLQSKDAATAYTFPVETMQHLMTLPGRKLIHSVGIPVGSSARPEANQLSLLKRMIDECRSPWASDHLSFNSTPDFKTGFFLPPRQTAEAIDKIVANIRDLQRALHVPIAVETGVNYLQPRSDELPDGMFTAMVAERADCGILLDLHNIFANELNGRQTMVEFLAQLPLDRVWEVHLAGGMEVDDYWLDAHSGAIAEPLFEIAKKIIPTLPNLRAIIFEIFPAFVQSVGLDVIRIQLLRLRELWNLRTSTTPSIDHRKENVMSPDLSGNGVSSAEWETTLGSLVIGRTLHTPLAQQLSTDPGVMLINKLVNEFRGSMIVRVLPLTSRFMMLSLGTETFRLILDEFWRTVPPSLFASTEALGFAAFLRNQNLALPKVLKILEYECAVVETLLDGQTRVVSFDFDPLPFLRALSQRRLPDTLSQLGDYEIEVTGKTLDDASSGMLANEFPFH